MASYLDNEPKFETFSFEFETKFEIFLLLKYN